MLSLKEILESTKGKYINGNLNKKIKSYVIDSRKVREGDFFIPFVGEKNDAHNYIIDSVKKGICGFFVQEGYEKIADEALKINKELLIVKLKSNSKGLLDIAKYNREKYIKIPIVAVTGSVGKTSTKEMIASILEQKYSKVLKTEQNYNSDIGLPYMLLKLKDQDIAVLEVGIGKEGEMDKLSEILKPDISVITNIGVSHIEFLKNKEITLKEKFKITKFANKKVLVFNNDDVILKKLEKIIKNIDLKEFKLIKFSIKNAKNLSINEEIRFSTVINQKEENVVIKAKGTQNIINSLAAIKVAEELKIENNHILKGIKKYKNYSRRFEERKLKKGVVLIDDAYNASYDSMKKGLESFANYKYNKKIIIIGDVFELGNETKRVHEDIGKILNENTKDIEKVFLVGENIKYASNKIKDKNKLKEFENINELIKYIKNIELENTAIYFKASNGMNFKKIVDFLIELYK